MGMRIALLVVSACLAGGALAAEPAPFVRLPAGFRAEILVDGVKGARSMALSEQGTLYVGTRFGDGSLYAIRNALGPQPEVLRLATGLNIPNGVALHDGALYVAEQRRIIRFPRVEQGLGSPAVPEVVDAALPYKSVLHSWKYLAFGPDGKLYVTVGVPCNICEVEQGFGTILRMNPDGSNREVYASGVRNSVGLDWRPGTGELWFTDNGRDMLGDEVPPCELNRVTRAGQNFGFPFCHAGTIPDPQFGNRGRCAEAEPPVQALGPHVAPLGLRFYTGRMFPEAYRGQVFIAEHGSWNRSKAAGRTGYRISLVRLQGDRAVAYEPFAEGWLDGDQVRGRPVDLLVAPDGSLLVSDDERGAIYRISYGPAR